MSVVTLCCGILAIDFWFFRALSIAHSLLFLLLMSLFATGAESDTLSSTESLDHGGSVQKPKIFQNHSKLNELGVEIFIYLLFSLCWDEFIELNDLSFITRTVEWPHWRHLWKKMKQKSHWNWESNWNHSNEVLMYEISVYLNFEN